MANLSLKNVGKVYPSGVKAVTDFSLEISDGEFIVLVGPSGCGKSTILRMIAGLESVTVGEIKIDGVIVNQLPPKRRGVAMVFQNFALYPHMTVFENMAFGLKVAKVDKAEIKNQVLKAANLLGITDELDRLPSTLSGGQRQRVALGRAIVSSPKVFLLDEPLSNLDAKMRSSMRSELIKLHGQLKATFVYVTHDQVEAMTMGSRIVVMNKGIIQQVGTPREIYDTPKNKFVAGFIGNPPMNFLDANLQKNGNNLFISVCDSLLPIDSTLLKKRQSYSIGIRAEDIYLAKDIKDKDNYLMLSGKVSHIEDLGADRLIYVLVGSCHPLTLRVKEVRDIYKNDNILIALDKSKIKFFDSSTGLLLN